jgi:hypothetical protein
MQATGPTVHQRQNDVSAVFRIRDILVRIRILGAVQLIPDRAPDPASYPAPAPDPALFVWTVKMQTKIWVFSNLLFVITFFM